MDRSERFNKIDQMLSARGVVATKTFLDELGVSRATFKRDLEYQIDRFHAPIVWDRDARGYRFDEAKRAGPKYSLPGMWFNDSELHALLTMQQLLNEVEPGLLQPHLQPLQSKLHAILVSIDDSPDEIAKRVRIFASGRRKSQIRHFQTIATATVRRRRLKIVHYSRIHDVHTERAVSPQQLVYYRDNWYVDCWCHLRNDIRSFAIDAIQSAELLVDPAKDVPLKKVREVLGSGYGIFSGADVSWAKLRIGSTRTKWVAQTVWHPQQKTSFDS